MYTVIVADDEEEIRRGIVEKYAGKNWDFVWLEEAENGAEALEMIEKLEPDAFAYGYSYTILVRSELARSVRGGELPTVQIAFLSGFDDFLMHSRRFNT